MARQIYICDNACFVPNPIASRPRTWLRTHTCVALVDCPWCGAVVGQLCKGMHRDFTTQTHALRREAAQWRLA